MQPSAVLSVPEHDVSTLVVARQIVVDDDTFVCWINEMFHGANSGNRTHGIHFTRVVLYRLSYVGELLLVGPVGFEPTCPKTAGFKPALYTSSKHGPMIV